MNQEESKENQKHIQKAKKAKKKSKKVQKKKRQRNAHLRKNKFSFKDEIYNYVTEIESLSKALDSIEPTLTKRLKKATSRFTKFVNEKNVSKVEQDNSLEFKLNVNNLSEFKRISNELLSCALAFRNVPRVFFCSLIHQYDAYLGRLLRVAFYSRPELLNSSEKVITFSDLVKYKSLEAARESVVDKEIESVIRESHIKQFKWMEHKFSIPLKKDLEIWPSFVEITERRNLFVHCGGVVSNQYLTTCNEEGVTFQKDIKVGHELNVSDEYFQSAFDCIYEIGVKLGHVLWRKLVPEDLKEATDSLHQITFGLLEQERYILTKNLLLFATEILKKHSSDRNRRIDRINLAIAYKFSGHSTKCAEVIKSDDWSACGEEFKLAVAVLEDRFEDASKIMSQIGKDGKLTREDYSTWPLFRDFRKSKEFLNTYKKLFGKESMIHEDKALEINVNN